MANGQGMAGLSGAAGGAAMGAKLGGTLGSVVPGVGNAVGLVGGAAIGGLVGGISGANKKKKANEAANISPVDPNEQRRMAELNQITKNLSIGADSLTQNRLSELQKVGAQTQGAISKVSGGDVGSTVQGMLQAQRNTQAGANAALADRGQLPYFQNLAQQLQTRQSQRKLELELLKRSQAMAETAQAQTDSNLNANAYASTLMGQDVGNIGSSLEGLNMPNINIPNINMPNAQGIKGLIQQLMPKSNAAMAIGLSGDDIGVIDSNAVQGVLNVGQGVI